VVRIWGVNRHAEVDISPAPFGAPGKIGNVILKF
jgi:hypothetical protein